MFTVVPTIDVEGAHGQQPFQQFVKGEVGDVDDWGVFRQAAIFQKYGISATFFVDCYEYTLWGKGELEEVCCRLCEMGQDVQLHTHPAWRDDIHDEVWLREYKKEKSYFPQHLDLMAKLSYDQQVEVLQHGCELLEKWIGRRPIAHRSGGYSINEDTIRALVDLEFVLDSSMHASHSNSKLTWSTNRMEHQSGLLQLPINLFLQTFHVPLGGERSFKVFGKLLNTDLDCCRLHDLLSFVEQGRQLGLKVMNLFMHSYSLLRFDTYYRKIGPDPRKVTTLDALLENLSARQDVQFLSCAALAKEYEKRPSDFRGADLVPEVPANGKVIKLACKKLRNTIVDSTIGVVDRCRRGRAA